MAKSAADKTIQSAAAGVRELATQFLANIERPGIEASLGCFSEGSLSVWVIASSTIEHQAALNAVVTEALKKYVQANLDAFGGEAAARGQDGDWEIDRMDGAGFVPFEEDS